MPAPPDGRRQQRLSDKGQGQIDPEIDDQQPVLSAAHDVTQQPRFVREHRTLDTIGTVAQHRIVPPQRQQIAMQRIGRGMARALAVIEQRALKGVVVGRIVEPFLRVFGR
jgi:hypothetical protein